MAVGVSPVVAIDVGCIVSSTVRGEDVGLEASEGDGMVGGGGSIAEYVVGGLEGTTGSGRAAMASSEDEVSIVIWVVGLDECRWA